MQSASHAIFTAIVAALVTLEDRWENGTLRLNTLRTSELLLKNRRFTYYAHARLWVISVSACFQQLTVTMFENMRVRITITESQGDGEAAQALISERIIETESHKRLTAKRAGQILSREYPELGDNAKRLVRMPQGWTVSKSTEPLRKCGYHYVWRHYYVASAEDAKRHDG